MGIAKGPAILLMKEAARKPFTGSLLTLGKQSVLMSYYQLKRYAKIAGFKKEIPEVEDPYESIQDTEFFSLLGFSNIRSLDYSDFEDASLQFDLNSGETPEEYREAFDVIYDGGTIEHIFHLPNALKSLIWMLKPGGRLIHLSPASNHLEHSFYMFSPTFFYDFYQANHFDINCVQIVRCTPCFGYEYRIYNYHSLCLAETDIGMGRLDKGMYLVHTIVTKTKESRSDIVPNQSIYSGALWQNTNAKPKLGMLEQIMGKKSYRKWKQIFKASPVYPLWAACKLKLRRHKVPLDLADRF